MQQANDLTMAMVGMADAHRAASQEGRDAITKAVIDRWYEMGITEKTIKALKAGNLTDKQLKAAEREFARAYVRHTQFTHRSKLHKTRFENDELLSRWVTSFLSYGRQMSSRTLMAGRRVQREFSRNGMMSGEAWQAIGKLLLGGAAGSALGVVIRDMLAGRDVTEREAMDIVDTMAKELAFGPSAMALDVLTAKYRTVARTKDGKPFYVRSTRGSMLGLSPHLSAVADFTDAAYNEGIGGVLSTAYGRSPGARAIGRRLPESQKPAKSRRRRRTGFSPGTSAAPPRPRTPFELPTLRGL